MPAPNEDVPWEDALDATTTYIADRTASEYGNAMPRCVHEEGEAFSGPYEIHETPNGTYLTNGSLSESHREALNTFLETYHPVSGECYANAMHLWEGMDAATYIEGFAFSTTGAGVMEHAWNSIDDVLVDVTLACEACTSASLSTKKRLGAVSTSVSNTTSGVSSRTGPTTISISPNAAISES